MVPDEFKQAIKSLFEKLGSSSIKWAVIGSTNMALQGIDVTPHDLDIVVKLNDIEKVKDIFRTDEIRKIKSTTKEPIWEVRTNINGVEVQIMAENFTGEYVSKLLAGRTTRVKIDNIDVPCFTLDAEAQAYSETNREHKAEIIHEFLKKRFK